MYLFSVESQRDEARKDGVQRGGQMDEIQSERNELRNSVVTLQASIKRLESDREDVIKCLEEARKRIAGNYAVVIDPSQRSPTNLCLLFCGVQ